MISPAQASWGNGESQLQAALQYAQQPTGAYDMPLGSQLRQEQVSQPSYASYAGWIGALALAALGGAVAGAAAVASAQAANNRKSDIEMAASAGMLQSDKFAVTAFAGGIREKVGNRFGATFRRALPEPRPNDAMLPVDFSRTSLYWGLLCITVLSVLFSSYFFN